MYKKHSQFIHIQPLNPESFNYQASSLFVHFLLFIKIYGDFVVHHKEVILRSLMKKLRNGKEKEDEN